MTRSAEFGATVKQGIRVIEPDLIIHARHESGRSDGPRVGFIVTRAVGNAVDRHRVARRLRHAVRGVLADLEPADRVVIRALPGSRDAPSPRLHREVEAGLSRARALIGAGR